MGTFGTCCCGPAAPPNVTSYRRRAGSATQYGFPPLFPGPVAGRYISAGWTGVSPFLQRLTVDELEAGGWPTLHMHSDGDRVARRFGAGGASVEYYELPAGFPPTPVGPPGGGWGLPLEVAAPPAVVNTYIAEGFWRGGVDDFFVGEIVYVCIPDAQETIDDWHVSIYVCTSDVQGAGNPASDPHFTPLFTSGQLSENELLSFPALYGQMLLTRVMADSFTAFKTAAHVNLVPGDVVSVGSSYYTIRAAVPAGAALQSNDCSQFLHTRALAPAERETYNAAACRGLAVQRFLSLATSTQLAGAVTAEAESNFGMNSVTGEVTGAYGTMDAGGGEVVVQNGQVETTLSLHHRFRCAYPFFPDVFMQELNAELDVARVQTVVRAFRLSNVVFGATTNTFEWELLVAIASEVVINNATGRIVGVNDQQLAKVTLTQTVSVAQENSEVGLVDAIQLEPQLGGMSSTLDASATPQSFYKGITLSRIVTDRVFLRGPQTASLRRGTCGQPRVCQNVVVLAGGQAFPFPNVTEIGASAQLIENRSC